MLYNEILLLFWRWQLIGRENTTKVKFSALQSVEFLNANVFLSLAAATKHTHSSATITAHAAFTPASG